MFWEDRLVVLVWKAWKRYLVAVFCCFALLKHRSESEVAQSCPTLYDPMDWLWPTRLLGPWDFPGKNTGVACHFLLQETFPTQRLSTGLPRCRQTVYCLRHQGSSWSIESMESWWLSLELRPWKLCTSMDCGSSGLSDMCEQPQPHPVAVVPNLCFLCFSLSSTSGLVWVRPASGMEERKQQQLLSSSCPNICVFLTENGRRIRLVTQQIGSFPCFTHKNIWMLCKHPPCLFFSYITRTCKSSWHFFSFTWTVGFML